MSDGPKFCIVSFSLSAALKGLYYRTEPIAVKVYARLDIEDVYTLFVAHQRDAEKHCQAKLNISHHGTYEITMESDGSIVTGELR